MVGDLAEVEVAHPRPRYTLGDTHIIFWPYFRAPANSNMLPTCQQSSWNDSVLAVAASRDRAGWIARHGAGSKRRRVRLGDYRFSKIDPRLIPPFVLRDRQRPRLGRRRPSVPVGTKYSIADLIRLDVGGSDSAHSTVRRSTQTYRSVSTWWSIVVVARLKAPRNETGTSEFSFSWKKDRVGMRSS